MITVSLTVPNSVCSLFSYLFFAVLVKFFILFEMSIFLPVAHVPSAHDSIGDRDPQEVVSVTSTPAHERFACIRYILESSLHTFEITLITSDLFFLNTLEITLISSDFYFLNTLEINLITLKESWSHSFCLNLATCKRLQQGILQHQVSHYLCSQLPSCFSRSLPQKLSEWS
jgi:hypothetical protein